MSKGRKQLSFDLDTKQLQLYYPNESWNNAYEVIKRHMLNNGFEWLQGSVYVSKKPITSLEVSKILRVLVKNNMWLNVCMRDCRETNIGKENNKSYIFDKYANVVKRIKQSEHQKDNVDKDDE